MKKLLVLAALSAGCAFAAPVGNDFLLQTKNTSMAFSKQDGAWLMLHYGKRIERAEDARLLANSRFAGSNYLCENKPLTYLTAGSDSHSGGRACTKFAGLSVIHADGALSSELHDAGAEIVKDAAGTEHLVLTLRDPAYPFTVKQHFRAFAAYDIIETWTEIRHDESAPVKLVQMDSAAFFFPLVAKKFYLMTLPGQWGSEGQIEETPVGKGQTVTLDSRSGVRSAMGNNASFMLSLDTPATETAGRVIAGALAWSGAWSIRVQHDQVDGLGLFAGAQNPSGPYTLDPGKTLVLPKLVLTTTDAGKGQVSRNFHRWARDIQLHEGHATRPILLNSWEGAYFTFTEKTLTDMMDGTKALGGEMFVVDDGWFGRGSYARNDGTSGLGDWVVNDAKLPHGLAWLAAQAKERGLDFGIWVEPEMANTNSALAVAHPDWLLRERTRKLRGGRGGSQVVLDLANPAVRENVFGQLDAMIASCPGLAYIKWDANSHFQNVGSEYLPRDRQANVWFDYTAGLYDLLDRLRAKYPTLQLNACSSGGGRMDYGFLKYATEFWTSDDTDARQRILIQWGASQFYPACAMAAHVTDVPNHQTKRVTPLKFRFDVAMMGRLGFELHPEKMTEEEVAFAKKAVADYKRIRPVVQQGDLYRLVSPWEENYAALDYVDETKDRAVAFVYGMTRLIGTDFPAPLRLQGLDPAKQYRVTEFNRVKGAKDHIKGNKKVLSGAALMEIGLPIRLQGDFDSIAIELAAVAPSI